MRVAVLTSGGDAPGMNAAIRSAIRTGLHEGWEMFGVRHGYQGLMTDDLVELRARDVGEIIERGGTILHTARCPEFETREGQLKALQMLQGHAIDALVIVGGNGSQKGAYALSELGYPVVGVASTIDNDLYGSDITIGANTALNIALESIDRLKVTASSHGRAFVVEVMGRDCGYLALMSGLAGGAESIVIPEIPCGPEQIAEDIRSAYSRAKPHAIIVVAEGATPCNVEELVQYFQKHRERLGFELRLTRLGHVQRGGAPSAFDRLLATRLAAAAVDQIKQHRHGVLMGLIRDQITATPLSEAANNKKELDLSLMGLARILAE